MMLSDVCLCVAYIGSKSRTERPIGRPKLAQRQPTSHVTRTPISRSKGQKLRSPGRFTHRRVGASGSCSGGRGNVLLLRCRLLGRARRFGAHGAGEERGHIVAAARLQLIIVKVDTNSFVT